MDMEKLLDRDEDIHTVVFVVQRLGWMGCNQSLWVWMLQGLGYHMDSEASNLGWITCEEIQARIEICSRIADGFMHNTLDKETGASWP